MAARKGGPVDGSTAGLEFDARREQRIRTAEALRTGRMPLVLVEVTETAVALAEETTRRALAQSPPRPPIACKEGCAWCCYKLVGTAAPEVLRIADYLRRTLAPADLEALCERVLRLDEQRRALAGDRWAAGRLPCPLLVEERCSVYPVRPLTCRGYNSSDAYRCERSYKSRSPVEVPRYAPQQAVATFTLDGLRAGLAEAGLKADLLELTAALRMALELPDAAERWLAGEPVFAAARLP
jgi:Fe-S-cluster containining protein